MNEPACILTIDDEPGIRRSIRSYFEDSGYRVIEAENGETGLDAFRSHAPDVVLVDLRMPGVDGMQVIETLAKEAPDTPVIVLSGTGIIADAIAAIRQGAWDYVTKPILDMAQMDHVVRTVMERARLRRLEKTHKERLEEEVAQRTKELSVLNARLRAIVDSTRAVAASPTILVAGERVLEEFARNMAADGGSIYLRSNESLHLVHTIDQGHAPKVIPLPMAPTSFFGAAVAAGKAILVRDACSESGKRSSGWGGYRDGSLLVFPFFAKSRELIGLIALHNKKTPPFTEQDLELGKILASHSCEAIQVALVTEDLRDTNELLQAVFDLSPQTISLTDVDGRYVTANDTLLRYLNRGLDEVKGHHFSEFVDAKDEQGRKDAWRLGDNQEMTIRKLDTGEENSILSSCRTLEHKGQHLVLNVTVDVTERKRIERELDHARLFTDAVIDSTPGVFFVLNDEGRFIRWNKGAEEVSGYSGEEIVRMDPTDFVVEEERPHIAALIQEGFRNGKTETEATYLTKSGARIPFYFAGLFRVIDGRVYLIAFGIDLSKQKSLESQLIQSQKMEAVGTLAGGVAHDFNNLLQAINGYSAMVLEDLDESSEQWDAINQVVRAGERASRLVNQLLTFGRRNPSEPADVDMNEVVSDMLKIIGRVLGETIAIEFRPKEVGNVYADRSMLEQVVLNLCVNARDAMPNGGTLLIETSDEELDAVYCARNRWARPGRFIILGVTDNGCGMDESTIRRIFEPFFTTKMEGKGTGLGLATSFAIIQQHHGFIHVDSTPGQGTTFRVFLPFRQTGETPSQNTDAGAIVGGTERILVAEDEEFVRHLVRNLLEGAGYQVVVVRDGDEAISEFQKEPHSFDLLLLDMIMPRLTGPETANIVWRKRPEIPVLFATGYDHDLQTLPDKSQSEYWVLRKPFQRADLLRMVRKAIDAARHTSAHP